ncbi:MAG TPA: calcium/sodium antiporter [Flavobacteriaceae bacterium]|nr:calcium/sodium antiporter [Flavobacteriaceae bacterium]
MSIFFIILGLVLLVIGGELLVRSSVGLSFKLKLSKMVIGLTVVSLSTSLPELLVSFQAALKGFSDISLGNVIGSNIANIGLVLGITAIISPLLIDKQFYRINWPVMMFFSLLLYYFLSNDNLLSRNEGIVLVVLMVVFLIVLIYSSRKNIEDVDESVDDKLARASYFKILVWLIVGSLALWGGAELLVDGAVDLAQMMGVSERVIAVTMIAVGTSVPELAASIIAALRKEKALSLGNLIGSNIFNIATVLGITALIHPIKVQSMEVLNFDILWMIAFAGVLLPLTLMRTKFQLARGKGLFLFMAYLVFIMITFIK